MKKKKKILILFGSGVLVGVLSWFIWGNSQEIDKLENNNDHKIV